MRGREANARPRHAGLPGPAGRHRAAGHGRARAGPDRSLERHPHPRQHRRRGILGCLDVPFAQCSITAILSDDDFTHDSTDYTVFGLILETDGSFSFAVDTIITTETAALTLVVGSTSLVLADATTTNNLDRTWASSGVSLTVGTAITVKLTAVTPPVTNAAPTVANAIQDQTATVGTALSYAFPANTFADTDPGDTLTYTATQSDDTALPSWLSFAAATRTFSGTPTAADVGTVSVKVTASDGHAGSVSDTFDIVVSAAPNTLATGAPTITGTAQVGQTLTAGTTAIMDADGLTSVSYTYQWIRVATDNTETNISSATTSTYMLVAADQGTTVKVRVSFTDDASNSETLTSTATATVGAAATAPTVTDVAVTSTPTSGTTYYLAGEAIAFTVTFSAPVTVTGTPKFAFRLGAATRQAAYASGSGTTALVFARTVQAGEVDSNGISWNALALALDGGTITQTGATTAARLTHAAQASLEGHRVDAAPPMQVSASVQGLALVLVYDEPLDPASMPATGAYTVTATVGATTTNPAVSAVSIYGIWVTLTLDAAPAAGATVTLAYAPPASNPVQDEAGNDAPAFSGQSVNVAAAPNTLATGAPTITGTATVGQTLTAGTTAIMDADGLTSVSYTYQWIRVATDNTETNISSATASTYTLVAADQGTTVKVRVSFTDDASNAETLTSAATAAVAAAPNTAATGAPTITGTATVGQTLTAGTTAIVDADGLTSVSYTYQWIRVATDNTETNISSATASTYTLVAADQGTTITVRVSFTDDASNAETLTSAATAAVAAAPNTAATGAPTITGTAQVGETLTASTTGIADANGLTTPGYTYQWIRVNGTEADIAGENSSTYTLVAADLGTTLKVKVSFTDDASNSETLTSAATAAVSAAANTLATGAPTITGTATVGQPLTAGTTAIMDADGLTSVSYTYQWIRVATDNTETNISSATASTYTLVAADQGTTITVRVSFTDDASNAETLTSAATAAVAAAPNTAATGAPTITGTATVGQTLTAGTTAIVDADGLTSVSYTYQWIRVATDNTETNISSATASTYTLVAADQGTTITVRVSFTDDASNAETRTSAATATVTATPAVPTREPEPEPEPEPVPALPLLGQLLLALGLAGAGAMRLVRAARRP